jgi:GNAT superfamily N-acetyltransferase
MTFRFATQDDAALLGEMNLQLIADERHRNRMALPELERRMRAWLAGEYRAVVFEERGKPVAYALFQERPDEVYLRRLFVTRDCRRRGYGRQALAILRSTVWSRSKRLTVDVLVDNHEALAFWRAMGYRDYSLTLEVVPEDGR